MNFMRGHYLTAATLILTAATREPAAAWSVPDTDGPVLVQISGRLIPKEQQHLELQSADDDGQGLSGVPAGAPAPLWHDATSPHEPLVGLLDAREASAAGELGVGHVGEHPFWKFEAEWLSRYNLYLCCLMLFAAGLLCSAGGIGGGGIYVTVLMVFGELSVNDAVPLSKAVVFLGAISSMCLNLGKKFVNKSAVEAQEAESLIDYNVCRLVIPSALIGTYGGVLLNQWLPSWVVLLLLTFILIMMTFTVAQTTAAQFMEEQRSSQRTSRADDAPSDPVLATSNSTASYGSVSGAAPAGERRPSSSQRPLKGSAVPWPEETSATSSAPKLRDHLTRSDVVLAVSMLVIIVTFSVLRYHLSICLAASPKEQPSVCHHPGVFYLGQRGLETIARHHHAAQLVELAALVLPLCMCVVTALSYARLLVAREGWCGAEACRYCSMSVVAGCLAGLVGIGGGLIFSPFFLLMGLEPATAVATSSTCVLFTSSSTTLQYLLTDRIIISLTLVYGGINLLASYAGTRFVHFLQDHYHTRRSIISGIVAMGVATSTLLSIMKLASVVATKYGWQGVDD